MGGYYPPIGHWPLACRGKIMKNIRKKLKAWWPWIVAELLLLFIAYNTYYLLYFLYKEPVSLFDIVLEQLNNKSSVCFTITYCFLFVTCFSIRSKPSVESSIDVFLYCALHSAFILLLIIISSVFVTVYMQKTLDFSTTQWKALNQLYTLGYNDLSALLTSCALFFLRLVSMGYIVCIVDKYCINIFGGIVVLIISACDWSLPYIFNKQLFTSLLPFSHTSIIQYVNKQNFIFRYISIVYWIILIFILLRVIRFIDCRKYKKRLVANAKYSRKSSYYAVVIIVLSGLITYESNRQILSLYSNSLINTLIYGNIFGNTTMQILAPAVALLSVYSDLDNNNSILRKCLKGSLVFIIGSALAFTIIAILWIISPVQSARTTMMDTMSYPFMPGHPVLAIAFYILFGSVYSGIIILIGNVLIQLTHKKENLYIVPLLVCNMYNILPATMPYALKRFIVPVCTYNIGVNSISVWKNLYDLIYLLLFAMIICIIKKADKKEICHEH